MELKTAKQHTWMGKVLTVMLAAAVLLWFFLAMGRLGSGQAQEGREQLAHIVDLQEFYYAKGDLDHLRQVDDQFHDTICYLSGRSVITDTLIPLHRKTRKFRRISINDPDRIPKTQQEHKEIYQAIISGNAELAMELTNLHIVKAKEHMIGGIKHG